MSSPAIDHADGQGGSGGADGRLRVAGSIVNRARDQQAAIATLTARAADARDTVGRHIDATNIALIGYSMGGFGAVATGGAPYDKAGGAVAPLGGRLDDQTVRQSVPGLKAIVAIAPWGGQPPYRAWTAAALAGITVPSLWIDGDRDDVSDYAAGVHWLYDHASRSNRWLLTYREARHNVGGNPPPPETLARPDLTENFAEPVWRSDRITAINQHFITAFLDRFLKGNAAHGAFLDVPTVDSDAATWADAPRGFAGPEQAHYWPGFQRRWLLGLELRHDLRSSGPVAAPGACPTSTKPDEIIVCLTPSGERRAAPHVRNPRWAARRRGDRRRLPPHPRQRRRRLDARELPRGRPVLRAQRLRP